MGYSTLALLRDHIIKENTDTTQILNINHGSVIWVPINDNELNQLIMLIRDKQDYFTHSELTKQPSRLVYHTIRKESFKELYEAFKEELSTSGINYLYSAYRGPDKYTITVIKSLGMRL